MTSVMCSDIVACVADFAGVRPLFDEPTPHICQRHISQVMLRSTLLDDWGLAPLGDPERRDLLELVEERAGRRATLVTSQLPIEHWHEMIGDATFGDAILDRLVHHAHRLTLTGGSLRRLAPTTTSSTTHAD